MSFLGTISNTVNNRVTNKPLEETVAELKTDIVSKERQLQAKTEQLQERNEYILQLEEQLRRVEATNQIAIPPESSNEQQRIETVNDEDENARNTHHSHRLPLPDNIPHHEELTINIKRSTSNIIPDAESRTKSDVDALLVAATLVAMMNIMPANAAKKVDAVYSSRPHHQRSSNNQWPRSIGPILRCGGKS